MVDVEKIIRELRAERALALATLIDVEGGSSKRLGARAIWGADDAFHGSLTSGGCVDADAARAAARIVACGRSEIIRVELGDEGLDFGMSCAGSVSVFVEPLDGVRERLIETFEAILEAQAGGCSADLILKLTDDPLRYDVRVHSDQPSVSDEGKTGGGRAGIIHEHGTDVFIQTFTPLPRLVVVGSSPISEPLVRLARAVGFDVILVSSRAVNDDRFPDASSVRTGIPSDICANLSLNSDSSVVITAHDYKHEVPVLKELAPRRLAYLGFVASRRRGTAVLEFLRATGSRSADVDRIRTPVGLDTGAVTPDEIAVSIVAELLAVRNGAQGGSMSRTHVALEGSEAK